MMDRESLAWAAGFFDGEGCITSTHRRNDITRKPTLSVWQVSPEPLYRFKNAVLGLGSIRGPITRYGNPNARPIWCYQAQNVQHIQAIIAMLWPFLCDPKRKDADRVLRELWDRVRISDNQKSSRYRGVHLHRKSGKWMVQVTVNGTKYYGGLHESEMAAAKFANDIRESKKTCR